MRPLLAQPTQHWSQAMPGFRRMMVFVDGENLVCRFQAMCKRPRGALGQKASGIDHVEDVAVWHRSFTSTVRKYEILRASYYTSAVGDTDQILRIGDQIASFRFDRHPQSTLPDNLVPVVFKRPVSKEHAKGLDIAMVVDILSHAHRDNFDSLLLMSGDGDFIPVIKEVQRCGKLCYVSAFSSGLNPELKRAADEFHLLDQLAFG